MSRRLSAGRCITGHTRKKAEQEQRTIVFVDEVGFYLLPMAVRTYALRGHTPVLRVKLTRDHLCAIGGITQQGRIFMQMQERASKAEDVVRFVRVRFAQDFWQAARHLGWLFHPSRRRDQSVSRQPRGQTGASGTLAGLRSGIESTRTGVEPAQTPRTQEPMLSGSGSPGARACACQGTPSPSARNPSTLLCPCS